MKYKNTAHKQYSKRNKQLKTLGFNNYSEYLRSESWKSIRSEVLKRKGRQCSFCKTLQNIQVHHLSYKRKILRGRKINPLIPLCDRCHGEISKIVRTHGINDQQATQVYRDMYFPEKKVSGKEKFERQFSLKIVRSSKLPATLHHSLHSTIKTWDIKSN